MLTIGSRGSRLAQWQAEWIKDRLEEQGQEARIEIIRTTGDMVLDVALSKVGTKGLFTKEIEEALLAGQVDLAVHSLKDMPTGLPAGLTLAAIPDRDDPRDALVGKRLDELRRGARVGTSSLRRSAQLRALRPDLAIESIRGNVDTRLRKLDEGQFDAIVLAAAGLRRLGWSARIAETLDISVMCPAVGQGALAVETRADGPAYEICRGLNDAAAETGVTAERALLASLGGGCQVPIGAHARVDGETLHLLGVIVSPDGSALIRRRSSGPMEAAGRIGRALGEALLAEGGREILDAVYAANPAAPLSQ